ncbi:hypothetical protein PIB30_058392 [Stylosanthes scabra]|uniref:Uncharacterized protein n=1 Tax=Stylosanthes scabra TaxID=79078 RepID=A0ABU6ZIN1_9FABA|nr:hypothetical protein [Stylosanthes scabra]
MADNNQHFKTRATTATKGLFEVAPSESTVLAKSLVDIAAMLKEIKEGQQEAPKILTQQPNTSQQMPVRHCGICSCNSHYTGECSQLQEDNTVAASHNFYEAPPPQNKQYQTQPQGWRDNQQTRWNSSQQQQPAQYRQKYTYNQPQNSQSQRYQTWQTYPTNFPINTF